MKNKTKCNKFLQTQIDSAFDLSVPRFGLEHLKLWLDHWVDWPGNNSVNHHQVSQNLRAHLLEGHYRQVCTEIHFLLFIPNIYFQQKRSKVVFKYRFLAYHAIPVYEELTYRWSHGTFIIEFFVLHICFVPYSSSAA